MPLLFFCRSACVQPGRVPRLPRARPKGQPPHRQTRGVSRQWSPEESHTTHLHRANHSPQPSHRGDSCSQGLLLPNLAPLLPLEGNLGVLNWDGLEHPSAYSHAPLFTRGHPAILGAPAADGGDLGPSGWPGQGRSERNPLLGAWASSVLPTLVPRKAGQDSFIGLQPPSRSPCLLRGTLPFQLEDLCSPASPRGPGGEGRRGRASARPSRPWGRALGVSRLETGHERQGHWVGSCLKVTNPREPPVRSQGTRSQAGRAARQGNQPCTPGCQDHCGVREEGAHVAMASSFARLLGD